MYQKAEYIAGSDTLPYRLLLPEDYDRSKSYPLVLFLHGAGERGKDNELQLLHGTSLFLKPENRHKYPCLVLVPQCPEESYWASRLYDENKSQHGYSYDYRNTITKSLRMALELTQKIIKTESVDAQRVYITGLSMGGMGTFEAVAREPNLFAAAAPICGGGDPKGFNGNGPQTPFWIFHGTDDPIVSVDYSREMYKQLKALGWEATYTEYPEVEHNSWDNAFAEPNFLKWMFSKQR